MARIVVTGAKGFIGSVLALRACERGHSVWALDDESRGLNNIGRETEDLPLIYARHDCLGGMREGLMDHGGHHLREVDAVVHLAAATGSLERPIEELRVYNVEMLKRAYTDALSLAAKIFLWPTTSLALGVPDSPYVQSKEEGLTWLRSVMTGVKPIAVPLRFFNVAGAYKGFTEVRKNEVHLVPRLVECVKHNQVFTINGLDYTETSDGTPSRDFVNVIDVANYLLYLIEMRLAGRDLPTPSNDGAIWLGTGRRMTVQDVLRLFWRVVGRVPRIEYGPRRAFDCWGLEGRHDQIDQFDSALGGLTPDWVSLRDEILELMEVL